MKELKSNSFILRNCFATDPHTPVKRTPKVSPTYVSEERKVDFFTGETRSMVEHEYPITKDYVKSFVDATDYRNGVGSPLPPRQNLGDVREAQDMVQRDTVDVKAMITDLKKKLADLEKLSSDPKQNPVGNVEKPVQTASAEGDVNNG